MGTGNSNLGDPNMMALLGALAGTSQFAGASRLPQTFGQAIGGAGAGLMAGIQQGQKYQMGQQELTKAAIDNAQALDALRTMQLGYGNPNPPSKADILSGKFEGTPTDVLQKFFQQGVTGGSATPQLPASPGGAAESPPIPGVPNAGQAMGAPPGFPGQLSAKLASMGYTPEQSAAVLGNANWESSLNPANTSGDQGTSMGLFQWHAPDRKAGLTQYAQQTGRPWTDPNVQLEFMDQELHAKAPEFFKTQNVADATKIFQDKFEIPAQDTSAGRTQLAQNFLGQSAGGDTAGGGVAATQPQQPGIPQGGGMPGLPQMMANIRFKQALKIPLTPVENMMFTASQYPAGSPIRNMLTNEAINQSGVHPFIGGERSGVPGRMYNPTTGRYDFSFSNPTAPPGFEIAAGPQGQDIMRQVPGGLPAVAGSHGAAAGGTEAGKQRYIQENEAFKALTETALKSNLPIDIHPGETVNINPGRVVPPTPIGGAAPPPLAVPLPQGLSSGGAMPGVTGAAPGTTGAPPGAAVASPTGGLTLQGMTPGQEETQKIQAKHEQDQRQTNIAMAEGAQNQNALISRMKLDVGNFPQGPLGARSTLAQSYLRELGFEGNAENVATAEEFNKNAGFILRKAVKDTSARAAVQEYKLIGATLPSQETSPLGTIRVLNEFQGLNDYLIAKNQAQAAWENKTGSVHGFETDWQNKVTPNAFMMFRATPQDRQAVIQKLQSSPEGRAQLKTLATQMQYLKDTGLEHTIQ